MNSRLLIPSLLSLLVGACSSSSSTPQEEPSPGSVGGEGGSATAGTTGTGGTSSHASGAGGSPAHGGTAGGASVAGSTNGGSAGVAGGGAAGVANGGSPAGGTGGGGASAGGQSGQGGASTQGAVVRVHYPAGSHSITIRGSAGGLDWTMGTTTTAVVDTWTFDLSALTGTAEWKPLLDDTTWARGPNYHVAEGQTLDVWPRFQGDMGQVVTLITSFHSTVLGNDRAIYAYLPPSYDENTDESYPVVYMHDGQNLWAALPQLAFGATWNVDTAFDDAAANGACSSATLSGWGAQPLGGTAVTCTSDGDCPSGACRTFPEAIVIGVANDAGRIYEYTPTTDPTTPGGGGADLYLQMLVTELKPAIDGMLRTRPDVASTSLAGSSLGGLVSAYAGLKYPGVYGSIAEISPSTWWNNDVLLADVMSTLLPAPQRPAILYVDSGQGDVDDEADTDMLAALYLSLGYTDGVNFRHVVQPGAVHNETYWAERFPGAMQLLLGDR